jgi:hypothetical protein
VRIYLASRYSRRVELCGYRDALAKVGHDVTSRWLNGSHQIGDFGQPIGDKGEALVEGDKGCDSEEAQALRIKFAQEDVCDVLAAQIVVSFTEPPRSNASRGGRHVEFGIALALNKPVIVVGYRENIFHWMPQVQFFPTWPKALQYLASIRP